MTRYVSGLKRNLQAFPCFKCSQKKGWANWNYLEAYHFNVDYWYFLFLFGNLSYEDLTFPFWVPYDHQVTCIRDIPGLLHLTDKARVRVCTHTHIHTFIHSFIHTYICTHTHTHTHTHKILDCRNYAVVIFDVLKNCYFCWK